MLKLTIQERRRDAIIEILKDVEFPVIVEAGACHGEDSQMLYYAANRRENIIHILIEPDPDNCKVIREKALNLSGRHLIEGAVAATSDVSKFNRAIEAVTGYRFCGSLLKPRAGVFGQMYFNEIFDVRTYTLDEIFEREKLTHIDLLWADIQGGERDMIQGGPLALSKTRYMFLEAAEEEQYVGQALRPELLSLLKGWSVVAEFGEDVLLKNEGFA